jgi:rhodanese-related sulfurtransferase
MDIIYVNNHHQFVLFSNKKLFIKNMASAFFKLIKRVHPYIYFLLIEVPTMSKSAMDLVQAAKANITEITILQANELFESGSIPLDVRELLEYETGHIPNASHISRGMLEFKIANHPNFQDKTASVVVYCKSGGRSALATETLEQLGFTNVQSMLGGFDDWNAGPDIPDETKDK